MKKYLLIIFLLFTGVQTQGQVLISLLFGDALNSDAIEFGLEGGFNWSNISGMETHKSLRTFNLGFYFDFKIQNQWSIYTGVLVKSNLGVDELSTNDLTFLGTEVYPENGTYSQEMRYFLVPALIRYTFENKIFVEAGAQFGLMYDAWVEYNSNIDGRDATVKEYNKDDINRIDAGIMAGLGYRLNKINGMSFAVKYYYGLVDVYKKRSGTKNSSIFVEVTVPIGAG